MSKPTAGSICRRSSQSCSYDMNPVSSRSLLFTGTRQTAVQIAFG